MITQQEQTPTLIEKPDIGWSKLFYNTDNGLWCYKKDNSDVVYCFVPAGASNPFKSVNVDYSIEGDDFNVALDASSNDVRVTMPDPSLFNGRTLRLTATDITNKADVVQFDGATKIFRFRDISEAISLISDGVSWKIY